MDNGAVASSSSSSGSGTKPPTSAMVVRVGVGVLIRNPDDPSRVLVGRRKGSHGSGFLALPGGHLEIQETVAQCALREVEEECGLSLDAASVQLVGVTQDLHKEGKHYITLFAMASMAPGAVTATPENREPHKCEGWVWEGLDSLAKKMEECFLPLRHALETFLVPEVLREDGKRLCVLNESLV